MITAGWGARHGQAGTAPQRVDYSRSPDPRIAEALELRRQAERASGAMRAWLLKQAEAAERAALPPPAQLRAQGLCARCGTRREHSRWAMCRACFGAGWRYCPSCACVFDVAAMGAAGYCGACHTRRARQWRGGVPRAEYHDARRARRCARLARVSRLWAMGCTIADAAAILGCQRKTIAQFIARARRAGLWDRPWRERC